MEVEWVVFDAVGTVIDPEPSVAVAYYNIGTKFGSERTPDDVRTRFSAAFAETEREDFSQGTGGLTTNAAVEEARWRHIVAAVFPEVTDAEGCFQELHDYFAKPTAWLPFDDTLSTLHSLSERRIRLAIASNFDHRLHSICDGIEALSLFEKRFVSSELGFRKPSKQFYRAVIAGLNVPAERVLMVGDGLQNDVEGALSVGMHAVLLDRRSAVSAHDGVAKPGGSEYSVIRTLTELQGLLS
ncbi:MAG: HAD-IA family hydrolase [Rhodopirellula sp.]|nr:HAD-IA family hydrolase [Rhodopirellula sp.]